MSGDDASRDLRSAVFRGDGRAIVGLLQAYEIPEDALQLTGDGLLGALDQHVEGAPELARELTGMLRERDWLGDDSLADQLNALLGTEPTSASAREAMTLKPLPVDLEQLSAILEGDPVYGGGRIDLETGEVWPQAAVDYARESGAEPGEEDEDYDEACEDKWLWVHCEGSGDSYRDMRDFIDEIDDDRLARRLSNALGGRGAFRRFKDVLADAPDGLDDWYAFSAERQRGRARFWLADAGYRVTLTPHAAPGTPP